MKESLDTTSGLSSFLLESAARINRKPDPVSAWRYPCLRGELLCSLLPDAALSWQSSLIARAACHEPA